MDLRRLRLFLAVVDHGGFTAAAAAEHVAQPAVSLAVRELEAELGATLLIRCPEFLLFDFPNCGAMAISMEVSDHMRQILEGQ